MNVETTAVAAPVMQIQRFWLQKVGTSMVHQYNEYLARRTDMIPVTHERAMELRQIEEDRRRNESEQRRLAHEAAYNAQAQQHANSFSGGAGAVAPIAPIAALPAGTPSGPKTLDQMNLGELNQEALRLNMLTDDNQARLLATLKAATGQAGVAALPMLNPAVSAVDPVPATLTLQPGAPTPEIPVAPALPAVAPPPPVAQAPAPAPAPAAPIAPPVTPAPAPAAPPVPAPPAVTAPPPPVAPPVVTPEVPVAPAVQTPPPAPPAAPAQGTDFGATLDTMSRTNMIKLIADNPALDGIPKNGKTIDMRENIKAVLSAGTNG